MYLIVNVMFFFYYCLITVWCCNIITLFPCKVPFSLFLMWCLNSNSQWFTVICQKITYHALQKHSSSSNTVATNSWLIVRLFQFFSDTYEPAVMLTVIISIPSCLYSPPATLSLLLLYSNISFVHCVCLFRSSLVSERSLWPSKQSAHFLQGN